jgi:hypothetical protein
VGFSGALVGHDDFNISATQAFPASVDVESSRHFKKSVHACSV